MKGGMRSGHAGTSNVVVPKRRIAENPQMEKGRKLGAVRTSPEIMGMQGRMKMKREAGADGPGRGQKDIEGKGGFCYVFRRAPFPRVRLPGSEVTLFLPSPVRGGGEK